MEFEFGFRSKSESSAHGATVLLCPLMAELWQRQCIQIQGPYRLLPAAGGKQEY